MITAHVPRPSSAPAAAGVAVKVPDATSTAPSLPLPGLTGCGVLEMLFNRAAPGMTVTELEHLSNQAGDLAHSIALRAAEVAEGVGALVADEGATEVMNGASGAFRNTSDLPGLLWHFGDVFQHVAGLVSVSGSAAFLARRERETRP